MSTLRIFPRTIIPRSNNQSVCLNHIIGRRKVGAKSIPNSTLMFRPPSLRSATGMPRTSSSIQKHWTRMDGTSNCSIHTSKVLSQALNNTTTTVIAPEAVSIPRADQLRNHFISQLVTFVGFGFVDQTVMIQAGNAVDLTIGVMFGLSTLTAAAFGQICSNVAGIIFGGTLESIAKQMGLPSSGMTALQRELPHVRRIRLAGQVFGIALGCTLGLVNLYFIDTDRSSTLKLQTNVVTTTKMNSANQLVPIDSGLNRSPILPVEQGQEPTQKMENHDTDQQQQVQDIVHFDFEASNQLRSDASIFIVRGPANIDRTLTLSAFVSTLAENDCALVELSMTEKKKDPNVLFSSSSSASCPDADPQEFSKDPSMIQVEDIFVVVDKVSGRPLKDDKLDVVAHKLVQACQILHKS